MRIVQILTTISFGDAVSNDTIALKDALRESGYDTEIYATNVDPRLPKGTAQKIKNMPGLSGDDLILYHLSTGTELNYQVIGFGAPVIMIYHNVTPNEYLFPYNPVAARLCRYGLNGAKFLADKVDYCLADSDWNRRDLLEMGYDCPIDVLPILIAFDDYKKTPNAKVLDMYKKPGTNILFTGRISPNKCQEDVIAAFACYKKYYDSEARLFLVGSWSGILCKIVGVYQRTGSQGCIFSRAYWI